MRDEEFINSLKKQADGFNITPSDGLFDKIIVSGNINNKLAETDFSNMLKEKAADFCVAPSAVLFDKINAAHKNEIESETIRFNDIVKKHASDFKVTPSEGLFEKTVIFRAALLAQKYAKYSLAFLLLLTTSSFFYWLSHNTDALKNDTGFASISENGNTEKPIESVETQLNKSNSNLGKHTYASKNAILGAKAERQFIKSTSSSVKNRKNSSLIIVENSHNVNPQITTALLSDNSSKMGEFKNENMGKLLNEIPSTIDIKNNSKITQSTPTVPSSSNNENDTKILVEENTFVSPDNVQARIAPLQSADLNSRPPLLLASRKKEMGAKWAIGVYGTPQLLKSEYYSNNTNENWANEYLKTKEENDKARFNYQAGFLLERKLNKNFSIVSGLGMAEIRFRELRVVTYLTPSESIGGSITISDKEYIRKSSYDVTMTYLEVPLMLQYNLHLNKLNIGLQTGMVYNFLTDANAAVYNSDTMNTCIVNGPKNKNLQKQVFYISGSLIAEYFPLKHISVFAGPTYRKALNSLYSEQYVLSQKPTFYGFTMGMKYSF